MQDGAIGKNRIEQPIDSNNEPGQFGRDESPSPRVFGCELLCLECLRAVARLSFGECEFHIIEAYRDYFPARLSPPSVWLLLRRRWVKLLPYPVWVSRPVTNRIARNEYRVEHRNNGCQQTGTGGVKPSNDGHGA
jgi:hypothetical protein